MIDGAIGRVISQRHAPISSVTRVFPSSYAANASPMPPPLATDRALQVT